MANLWFGCFDYYHAYRSGNIFNECLCVVLGAKHVAHFMKFDLLQWEVTKVKLLINSNMTLTVLNLYQKTDPKVQQDFKGHYGKVKGQIKVRPCCSTSTPPNQCPYQASLPTPYSFRDIALTRFYRSKSLRQGKRSNQGHTMAMHTYTP